MGGERFGLLISCSRRSDVPALHARWLMERLRQGHVDVVNPMNAHQVRRVSLRPGDVGGLVLWTRWPRPLLPRLDELRDRLQVTPLWLVTITGYPRALEPRTPPAARAVQALQALAAASGVDAVHWRYDPIVLSSLTPPAFHEERFGQLAHALAGATRVCHVSIVDLHYHKTRRRLAALAAAGVTVEDPLRAARRDLVRRLAAIARGCGIEVVACCAQDLCDPPQLGLDSEAATGVRAAGCVDPAWLGPADWRPPPRPTRPGCLCRASVDIGAYDTCSLGCVYCYATRSDRAGRLGRRRLRAEVDGGAVDPRFGQARAGVMVGADLPHDGDEA